jgi:hypothetical protein
VKPGGRDPFQVVRVGEELERLGRLDRQSLAALVEVDLQAGSRIEEA